MVVNRFAIVDFLYYKTCIMLWLCLNISIWCSYVRSQCPLRYGPLYLLKFVCRWGWTLFGRRIPEYDGIFCLIIYVGLHTGYVVTVARVCYSYPFNIYGLLGFKCQESKSSHRLLQFMW